MLQLHILKLDVYTAKWFTRLTYDGHHREVKGEYLGKAPTFAACFKFCNLFLSCFSTRFFLSCCLLAKGSSPGTAKSDDHNKDRLELISTKHKCTRPIRRRVEEMFKMYYHQFLNKINSKWKFLKQQGFELITISHLRLNDRYIILIICTIVSIATFPSFTGLIICNLVFLTVLYTCKKSQNDITNIYKFRLWISQSNSKI